MNPVALRSVTIDGHTLMLVEEPPPHLLFLASAVQERAAEADPMMSLAWMSGLLALLLRELDGEPVEVVKLPRNLDTLAEAGRQLLMELYERGVPATSAVQMATDAINSYKEASNPT